MFTFLTTTIINSDKDVRSDKALFSSIAEDAKHGAILRIKRDFTFEMPYIQKVYKKVASEPVMAEVTIDCDKLIKALPANTVYAKNFLQSVKRIIMMRQILPVE